MTDVIDKASARTEQLIQRSIEEAKKETGIPEKATGRCLFCDEPIKEDGRRFCDKYCAEDAETFGTIENPK